MRTKSRSAGERCDRNLGRTHQRAGWRTADFTFRGDVPVRIAGFRSARGIDQEDGVGAGEVCGVLFLEVFGSGDRHRLADVPLLALKSARNFHDV